MKHTLQTKIIIAAATVFALAQAQAKIFNTYYSCQVKKSSAKLAQLQCPAYSAKAIETPTEWIAEQKITHNAFVAVEVTPARLAQWEKINGFKPKPVKSGK